MLEKKKKKRKKEKWRASEWNLLKSTIMEMDNYSKWKKKRKKRRRRRKKYELTRFSISGEKFIYLLRYKWLQ